MSEEKVLTKQIIIQEVPKFDDVVDLSEYTKIDDDAAELLSQFEGDVSLNGLTELSDISAKHLTNGQIFSLEFHGLPEISESIALTLANFEGDWLGLSGLTNLSETIAEHLGSSKSDVLIFHKLSEISDKAAEKLSKFSGENLDIGLSELSVTQADIFATCTCDSITFGRLEKLTDAAAESLSKYKAGEIRLPEEFMEKLAQYR